MASPFPANATLTFSVASGALTTNPRTGNKEPAQLATSIEVYLKSDSRPRSLYYPGIDEQEEPLSGRCVNPSVLPDGVTHGDKGWVSIRNVVTKKVEKAGYFTLSRGVGSAFGVEGALGAKISGIFRAAQGASAGAVIPQSTPGQYPSAIALALHRLVTLVNGQLVYADAANVAQIEGAIGLTLNAVTSGNKPQLATIGLVEDAAWNWTPDQPVFVGSAGNLTQNPLTTAPGYYQEIGVAVSSVRIALSFGEAYLL